MLMLVASCASAPKPIVLPTSVPKGALEAICLRLHDEGMSGALRVVGNSQPLITRAALQALAEAAFFRGNVDPESVTSAVAPPVPVDVPDRSCATRVIESIDPRRDADAMVLQFSRPFANPFAHRQLGLLARLSLGGESATWYWIPLAQQNTRWIAGSPMTLSVTE
jgi:hypothetical protein